MAMPGIKQHQIWLFIAPFFVVFAVFTVWPLIFNAWLAFHDYFFRGGHTLWNGFANFVALADDDQYFHPAVKNTLLFLVVVPIIQVVSLGLALLVSPKRLGAFRAMLYLPVILAVSIAGVVWRQVLHAEGMLNQMLASITGLPLLDMPPWLDSPSTAMYGVLLFFCWKHIGYYMVLYLAGLQMVPKQLLEAAMLDGAGVWMRIRHVILPAIQPVILLCTLLTTIAALKAFQEVMVLTGGESDTITVQMYVYGAAMYSQNFGLGAAAAFLMSIFCLALAWVQWQLFGETGLLRGRK
ncbi:sugar ABC transporter permease [Chitinibacter bivalviorum]|uniref:Sugar ABC transporter permease n=1 Tax=Chitinibacter bivalviorum TaxID=2739434 RepID=A0A7H9BKQ8_9NEIS|nr:sugar ABC transporter permease [Chitinibacter bivalviorum]QLG88848.1 sugar ABC transporter permease [Chitinibacter bivalviorum]